MGNNQYIDFEDWQATFDEKREKLLDFIKDYITNETGLENMVVHNTVSPKDYPSIKITLSRYNINDVVHLISDSIGAAESEITKKKLIDLDSALVLLQKNEISYHIFMTKDERHCTLGLIKTSKLEKEPNLADNTPPAFLDYVAGYMEDPFNWQNYDLDISRAIKVTSYKYGISIRSVAFYDDELLPILNSAIQTSDYFNQPKEFTEFNQSIELKNEKGVYSANITSTALKKVRGPIITKFKLTEIISSDTKT